MKSTKRLALFLVLVILLTSLQSCDAPVTHRYTNKYDSINYQVFVMYDSHVEYGEIITVEFSMGKIRSSIIIKQLLDDDLEISFRDSEYYEVVGQSTYIIPHFIDEKYNLVNGNYPITVKFDVKITSPNYEKQSAIIDVKYNFEPHNNIVDEINDGTMEHEIKAFNFLSDDDGVIVYYLSGNYPFDESMQSR